MKKISAVLLIAVLASGLVFAGFSGNAEVRFGGDLDKGTFGFIKESTNVTFNMDVLTAVGEAKGEGDIYAEIKGSLKLYLTNGEKGGASMSDPTTIVMSANGNSLGLQAKIESAKIMGKDWYVGILSVPSVPDFAKSAVDTYTIEKQHDKLGWEKKDQDKNATYSVAYKKAPGVEVGVAGYKFGVGLLGKVGEGDDFKTVAKNTEATLYVSTPDYALADGMTLTVAAVASQKTIDSVRAFGGSAKFAVKTDSVKASVATDIGYNVLGVDKQKFGADVALNVAFAPVTVDAYYATRAKTGEKPNATDPKKTDSSYTKNLVSAKVVADLNTYEVPVKLTVTGKDLIAKQDLSLAAEIGVMKGLTVTAKGGYVIANNGRTGEDPTEFNNVTLRKGKWSAGADVKYAAEKFTVKAGASVSQVKDAEMQVKGNASVETTAIIPGATLKLAWAGDDLTQKIAGDHDNGNLGAVYAGCKIAF
ncbi:MAG: hypothetical protein SPD11_03775 [Sphaerochaetaceae bacterium]|nr:hypothetical protein [Sphaerochaetaceae bacterium]